MTENRRALVDNKLAEMGLKSPSLTDGLLFADDPTLHRQIKRRIRQRLTASGKTPTPSEIDAVLPQELTLFLTEEVELQNVDFLIASEKLNKPVFEKILRNLAHLDFRSFVNARQGEFSLYDPDVITPQVSWAVEQIFQNLPGFFDLFEEMVKQDESLEEEQTNIIRNIFIIGYLHGFFSDANQNLVSAKLFLAGAIRKSNTDEEKLKPYPAFLRKIVEADEFAQVSPRLDHLKRHWQQQLVPRWLMLARIDEASADALSQSTQKQAEKKLPIDGRPAENIAVARKMDALTEMRMTLQGKNHLASEDTGLRSSNENAQIREGMFLEMDIAQLRQSTITHMRDILRLYQGNDQEVFHNGYQNTEKWLSYKIAAEQILQKLVLGFASLNESKNDDIKFDSAMDAIIKSMIQSLANPDGNISLLVKEMFGADFFSLAKIEQLCLLSFTALSFINRETSTSKLAIQILDRMVVPRLNQHFDIDVFKERSADSNNSFNFSVFDQQYFLDKSKQAKLVLGNLQPTDELVGIDSTIFLQLLKEKRQQLAGISKIYSLFATLTSENWGNYAKFRTAILGLIFAITAFVSGYLNFNLSQDLLAESLKTIFSEDPYAFLLKIIPISLTITSGALLMGDKARQDFKKLLLSSSELAKELKKFSKGGWRQVAMLLFLSTYALGSTFPQWEHQAEEWWDLAKERWEEMFSSDEETTEKQDLASSMRDFWEDRSPEAVDAKDLLNIGKVDWGEVVIGEDVYGKAAGTPMGFINTYVVSPIASESDHQGYDTETNMINFENDSRADDIIVHATSYSVRGDQIVFILANGETYIQPAAGADFIIKNGITTSQHGFVRFLDTGRYIDKIIAVPASDQKNDPGFFSDKELFSYYDYPDQYANILLDNGYEYFAVYKTNPVATNEMDVGKLRLDENLVFWQTHAEERQIIQSALQKDNPVAAALYSQMLIEQSRFWENYTPQGSYEYDYLKMVRQQIADYNNFVRTNHVYSLQYNPETNYVEQYPDAGVLLDVMALKTGGYYCLTAHLAAQEWFLSLGVPMDGLYGYHIYDDEGKARSRIGHVQTGIYGAVYDFTPSTPNPGEDLRALAFDKNTPINGRLDSQVADEQGIVMDLLQKFASPENLSLIIFLLSSVGIGYSVKLGIKQAMGKTADNDANKLDQIKHILPDNELALRGLASALLQLLNLIAEVDQLFPNTDVSSSNRSQVLSQVVNEILILATTPSDTQADMVNSLPFNSDVLSLIQLVGLGNGPLSEKAGEQVERLWQKLGDNKKQTEQLLREVLGLINRASVDFGKASEIKRKTLSQSVRKLQKQLMRTRRKENRIYGMYGTFLEKSQLAKDKKISELRKAITADYMAINHELDQQSRQLRQLDMQAKLLPINVKNLKKVLNFILNDIKKHGVTK